MMLENKINSFGSYQESLSTIWSFQQPLDAEKSPTEASQFPTHLLLKYSHCV